MKRFSHTLIALSLLACLFYVNIAASQNLPWGDDFLDGDLSGWTVIDDEPYSSGPSSWLVTAGELLQTSNIFTNENEYSVFKGTHIYTGNSEWSDYYFVVRMASDDNDGIGMLFRYQDEDNYYRFLTVQDPGNRGPFKRLEKQVNGQFTTLAQSTSNIKIPGDFVGKVRVVDDSIYVYEDNELLFAVQDNSFKSGEIGLMCYANPGAVFDDVYVSEQDTVYGDKTDPYIFIANRKLLVRALTLNIWVQGKICTPAQVADLIQALDLDVVGLQECDHEFGNQVAELTGMHMAADYDCFLYSRTPYTKVSKLPVKGINAWTNIDSQTVSIYNFHIGWDESGDRSARTMVDIFGNDPVPKQIAIGDFNDEQYSTQINILEEHMRLGMADLGWAPCQRVTWPAFKFYGGEGAQTIDLIFCNKESKGRVIEGEIMNTSPLLSDHKPVWATVEFPPNKDEIGPQLIRVIPYLGSEMIELWFDQDLDPESVSDIANYQIMPINGGASVTVSQAMMLKHARRVRLHTSPHEFNKKYQISILNLTDTFNIPVMPGSVLEYTVIENLLTNSGAEDGSLGWEADGGFTAVSERENQLPYTGNYFFTGEALQDLSTGTQLIDLTQWAEAIDAGNIAAVWNCYFATGYELLGEIKASRCEPYDEGEMIIDFMNEAGDIMLQASSKRWDTLFWHPYGESTNIPPATRKAAIKISSYRKTANGLSNDAAFDNLFFAIKSLTVPHSEGRNLLRNPSAETGDLTGWDLSGSIRARAHEEDQARPLSGYYMFSNSGASQASASQSVDVSDLSDQTDSGDMVVSWGGYMRDYRGDSTGEIKIEFYDNENNFIGSATTGEERVAEWWYYNTETNLPVGTRSIKFIISLDAIADEGVYFDFLHLIPRSYQSTDIGTGSIIQNEFELGQNYPNPFNPETVIRYRLQHDSQVDLNIYNLAGQEVLSLVSERQSAGSYKYHLNASRLSSGVYMYRLNTGTFSKTKKLTILK